MRIEQLGEGDPEVAVVGGIHGDEPCGVRAVEHLIAERPRVDRPVALVIANEEAAAENRRYLESDLNRSFPGDPEGETHESRLAHALGEAIGDCTTLALHSTQSYERMFALVDELGDVEREICPRLSVDAVVETGAAEGRIFDAVPTTIEIECGYQGSERAAENAIQVTREFLGATGVLPKAERPRQDDLPVFRLGEAIPKRAAEEYEVFAENFEEVLAGETFAAADGEGVVADEAFHPVLMSPYGYEDVFGYTAERVGTLSV
jgi:predicted deacylase